MAVIEKEKALYQFEVPENQINPHFLFNSLNVLASPLLIRIPKDEPVCQEAVYGVPLSAHYAWQAATVTVQEELSFVESYLYLEHIRFGDALHVEIEDDLWNHHCLVIPASIQMLVENALKHNISTKKSPLIVHIHRKRRDYGTQQSSVAQPCGCNGSGIEEPATAVCPLMARWWRFLRRKGVCGETSLCGRRREPSQHNITFPKKNLKRASCP